MKKGDGYKSDSHEASITYLKNLGIEDSITEQLDEFRYERNSSIARNFNKNKERVALIMRDKAKLALYKVSTDYIIFNNVNYLNVSVYGFLQRFVPEAKLASHLPDKQGLHRHLGSIPSWDASALNFNYKRVKNEQ